MALSGACRPDFDGLTSGDGAGRGGSAGARLDGGNAGCEDDCTSGAGGVSAGGRSGSSAGGSSGHGRGGASGKGGVLGSGGAGNQAGSSEPTDGGSSAAGSGGEGGGGIEECFPVVPEGAPPIVLYDFEDESTDAIADSSGNGNDATLEGGRRIANGRHGRALEFSATGEHAAFSGTVMTALDSMTVAAWVRLDAAPAGATLFEFGSDEANRIVLTANTGSGMRFAAILAGEEEAIVLPRALPTEAWIHVATVIAGGKSLLYVNGVEVARIGATIAPSHFGATSTAWIGKGRDPDVAFEWALDDFRIYDRGLSREELVALAVPDHLYFDFDEPCGARVHDRSARGVVGELPHGGTWGSGRIGGSLELDGTEQYVALPPGIVQDCQDFTLAFWAQRTGATRASEHIIDFGQNQRTFLYVTPQARGGSETSPGPVRFAMKLNGGENDVGAERALVGQGPIPLGSWQHIAIVIRDDMGYGTLYVDGRQYSSQPLPNRPADLGATSSNTIGRSQYYNAALGPDPFYAGRIDDLRIACRPFSAAEIAFLAINP